MTDLESGFRALVRWREERNLAWFRCQHGEPTGTWTPEERANGLRQGLREVSWDIVPPEHWHTLTAFRLLTPEEQLQVILGTEPLNPTA